MAGICCGVVGEGETPTPIEPSRSSRRRRLDLLPLKYIADMAVPPPETGLKRQKLDLCTTSSPTTTKPRDCENAVENCESSGVNKQEEQNKEPKGDELLQSTVSLLNSTATAKLGNEAVNEVPKFGVTSVCGRRRDMEDSVSVRPSFCQEQSENNKKDFHFYGVFDGHGCSHVNARSIEIDSF